MNRIVLVLVSILTLTLISKAQPVFVDDFESGTLTSGGWTFWQGDSATSPDWGNDADKGNFQPGCAISYSWDDVAYNADNFLVTPLIDLSAVSASTLEFTYYWSNGPNEGNFPDAHDLYIMLSKPDSVQEILDSAIHLIRIEGDGLGTYNKVAIDFTSYIGEDSVYVIFRHNEVDQQYLAIDDVLLHEIPDFEAAIGSVNIDRLGFGRFGSIPAVHLPPLTCSVEIFNEGTKDFTGYNIQMDLRPNQSAAFIFGDETIPAGDTLVASGEINLMNPVANETYEMDVTVYIDSIEGYNFNNAVSNQFVLRTSDNWYSRVDTSFFGAMVEETPDVYVDRDLGVAADRIVDVTTSGPSGEDLTKIRYGSSFNFNGKTNISQISVMVAPQGTGQNTWVEIYKYEDAMNLSTPSIEPIYESAIIQVPANFDDGEIHEMIYDFADFGGVVVEDPGKYVVCVVEEANSQEKALGILGYRDVNQDWSASNNGMYSVEYISSMGEISTDFTDLELSTISLIDVFTTWPISLVVQDAVGFKEQMSKHAIFPNPTTGITYLQLDNSKQLKQMYIQDVMGRIVFNKSYQNKGSELEEVDLSKLPSGIYNITLEYELSTITSRLIRR